LKFFSRFAIRIGDYDTGVFMKRNRKSKLTEIFFSVLILVGIVVLLAAFIMNGTSDLESSSYFLLLVIGISCILFGIGYFIKESSHKKKR
jgi:uncharacterized membrane protein HdeD (DUF308 family)